MDIVLIVGVDGIGLNACNLLCVVLRLLFKEALMLIKLI